MQATDYIVQTWMKHTITTERHCYRQQPKYESKGTDTTVTVSIKIMAVLPKLTGEQ